MGRQLFLIDPIGRLRPEKDSSVALMQAGQRAGEEIWAAQPSDLAAGAGGGRTALSGCVFVVTHQYCLVF